MGTKRVGVIMGGKSAEREVSLKTGKGIVNALSSRGYDVVEIDAVNDVAAAIGSAQIDAAFVALHGRFGEDGLIQGMLEIMGIPYNGSGVLSSAMAMDKIVSSTILRSADLPVGRNCILTPDSKLTLFDGWSLPVVIKPSDEGSSFGISIVQNRESWDSALKEAFKYSTRVMMEEYLAGPEITVAILNGRVLGSLEIEPHAEFYNYSAKYDDGGSTHHIPPRIPESIDKEAQKLGLLAYNALLCSGAARVDFIIKDRKTPVILEVNTLPGMTKTSLLPEIAKAQGMSFEDLVVEIVETASLHA